MHSGLGQLRPFRELWDIFLAHLQARFPYTVFCISVGAIFDDHPETPGAFIIVYIPHPNPSAHALKRRFWRTFLSIETST